MASLKERTGVKTDSSLDRWVGSQGKMVLFKQRRKPGSQAATGLQRVGSKTIPPPIHLLILPPLTGSGEAGQHRDARQPIVCF